MKIRRVDGGSGEIPTARKGRCLAGGDMVANVRVKHARCVSRGRVLARVVCVETSVFENLARTRRASY